MQVLKNCETANNCRMIENDSVTRIKSHVSDKFTQHRENQFTSIQSASLQKEIFIVFLSPKKIFSFFPGEARASAPKRSDATAPRISISVFRAPEVKNMGHAVI